MKMEEIMDNIKILAKGQGFYGRLLASIETLKIEYPNDYKKLVEELESKNFKDVVDLVLYIEC